VNARTSIITAAVMLTLVVPAAAGAASARADTTFRFAKETVAGHKLGQSQAVHKNRAIKTAKASKKAAAKSSKQAVHPVIYIYEPAPATPPSTSVDPNACEDSGNSCTDQQACEYWGMNCDAISTTADQTTTTPAAAAAPTDTTPPSPTTTTTDLNAGNCADYNDYLATNDPSYC
jgi:hypothetical protein